MSGNEATDNGAKPAPRRPGDVLLHDYLRPRQISQLALAEATGIPRQTINEIVNGHHIITPEVAWKLAAALDTMPDLWTSLQAAYDLWRKRPKRIAGIPRLSQGDGRSRAPQPDVPTSPSRKGHKRVEPG